MIEAARREDAFRSALGRLPVAVVVVDGDRALTPYNKRAEALFEREGLSGDLVEARPSHPLSALVRKIVSADADLDDCLLTFPSGRRYRVEPSRRSEKGSGRWLLKLISPAPEETSLEAFALTPRERQVAELALRGASTKSICETLHISRETLKTHMRRLFEKTGTNNRTALVAKLLRR
jgi:DNA-binding CsgD family transcriptional regulator